MAIVTETARAGITCDLQKHHLEEDCRQLLNEPNLFTDVTILVDGQRFPAHKLFLAMRSPVFAAMFSHKLKENETNEVHIEDTDPEVVQAMLEFIYTDRVSNITPLARDLLAVADKYNLVGLKTMCEEKLYETLQTDNAGEILMLAEMYGSSDFVSCVIGFVSDHFRDIVQTEAFDEVNSVEILKRLMDALAAKKRRRAHA
uniref:BTB domain-containing protein n=1 Tax=Bracon brevicornis TaxID=1563983 RepID=A0A6V7J9U8_9HYME